MLGCIVLFDKCTMVRRYPELGTAPRQQYGLKVYASLSHLSKGGISYM